MREFREDGVLSQYVWDVRPTARTYSPLAIPQSLLA
jgi:hypothetical protein